MDAVVCAKGADGLEVPTAINARIANGGCEKAVIGIWAANHFIAFPSWREDMVDRWCVSFFGLFIPNVQGEDL